MLESCGFSRVKDISVLLRITIGIEISPTPPLIFTGGGSKSAKFGVVFNITQFENAARYLNSQTKFLCRNDRHMPLPSLAKLGLRTPENLLAVVPQPLKLHGENDKLITLRPNC